MTRNTVSRSLHDLGLAAWFGGTLANAVALNQASAHAETRQASGRVANIGWDKWTPVNAAAIGIHLVGSLGQLSGNKSRLAGQQGVATMAIVKTALTAVALGATGYSRVLGRTVSERTDVPVDSATEAASITPPEVEQAQQRLAALQWAIPAVTGALIVVSSFAGEQQRPTSVSRDILRRLTPG